MRTMSLAPKEAACPWSPKLIESAACACAVKHAAASATASTGSARLVLRPWRGNTRVVLVVMGDHRPRRRLQRSYPVLTRSRKAQAARDGDVEAEPPPVRKGVRV